MANFWSNLKYFPIWILTLLPLRVLYIFSDIFYLLIYYIVRYRKKAVYNNLRNSFPEKSKKELVSTAKKFYRHLCDSFIEGIYAYNISEKEIGKRFRYKNPELINELYAKGKSVILIAGHYGNWEWPIGLPLWSDYLLLGIYRPLSSRYFDELFIKIRSKFGGIPVTIKQTLRVLKQYAAKKKLTITYFLSDQRPGMESIHYWTSFLNQETPIITGVEKVARKLKQAVVFIEVQSVKRGYYETEFTLLSEDASLTKEFEITELHTRKLEKIIINKPEYWLWSHKRWKFKKEDYQ
jgi:Kdo2-lipid IVA lauroyltransferase/acyltransferase